MQFFYLALAIVTEVVATTAPCEGFTRPLPSFVVIAGYGIAFYCLALAQKTLPLGLIYAIWSGAGIVLVSLAAWLIYGIVGVVLINAFSKSVPH